MGFILGDKERMKSRLGSTLIVFAAGIVFAACSNSSRAQQNGSGAGVSASSGLPFMSLPDAPSPQLEVASAADPSAQAQNAQPPPAAPNPSSSAGSGAQQSNSGAQTSTPPPAPQQSQHDKAAEQIKEQEKQRIVGILPSFNVTYRSDAASMSARQKIGLAFRSAIDPYTFGIAFVVSGFFRGAGRRHGIWLGRGRLLQALRSGLSRRLRRRDDWQRLPARSPAPGSALLSSGPRQLSPPALLCHRHQLHLQTRQHRKMGAQLLQRRRQHHRRRHLQSLLPIANSRLGPNHRQWLDRHHRRHLRRRTAGVLARHLAQALPQRPHAWPRRPGGRSRQSKNEEPLRRRRPSSSDTANPK